MIVYIGAIAFMGFSVFGRVFVVGVKGSETNTPPAIKEMVKLYASCCCMFGFTMQKVKQYLFFS